MKITEKLHKVIIRRAKIARRWHHMDLEAIPEFVLGHPDVEALLQNPVVAKAAFRETNLKLIEEVLDGKNIEKNRRQFGDDLIDRIIATSKQLKDEEGDNA